MKPSILLVGCGRLGGAILDGWLAAEAVDASTLAIQSPSMKPSIERALGGGAGYNPQDLSGVETVVLAVKPAKWRAIGEALASRVGDRAVVLSVMAGVRSESLGEVFGTRPLARLMPTTAVAVATGVAGLWAQDERAKSRARALFSPIADLVELASEDLIDVATAVSGSGAAYAYAFVRALARAGEAQGLDFEDAMRLAVGTTDGAVARLLASPDPDALIGEVASPGGTTEAGLAVLEPALTTLVDATVSAALARARTLSMS